MTQNGFVRQINASGSALILTVVLTTLMAIVGAMFLFSSRIEKLSTSYLMDEKELNIAVDELVGLLSNQISNDVPGVAGAEYYDYAGTNDTWLASNAPYYDGTGYYWPQISDVNGYFATHGFSTQRINVDPDPPLGIGTRDVIPGHFEIDLNESIRQMADADGDGIADSKWFEYRTTGKGQTIYAAVRVIDNGGMINLNTAYEFDPNGSIEEFDGSLLSQINLEGLIKPLDGSDSAWEIHRYRCNNTVAGLETFNDEMVWRLPTPDSNYLPFSIADELELRYRYCIDSPAYERIEEILEGTSNTNWNGTVDNSYKLYDASSNYGLGDWRDRITDPYDVRADRRHMLTAVNYDRILTPDGEKQININDANSIGASGLFNKFRDMFKNLEPNSYDVNDLCAKLAVNLKDYIDSDSQVSVMNDPCDFYYGFETPCVYISELAHNFETVDIGDGVTEVQRSYAIELHKPYYEDIDPNANSWRLDINDSNYPVKWDLKFGSRRFHVLRWEEPNAPLNFNFTDVDEPNAGGYVPGSYLGTVQVEAKSPTDIIFDVSNLIKLQRKVDGNWLTVDSVVPNASGMWLKTDAGELSLKRDIHRGKCVRGLWQGAGAAGVPNLGGDNGYDNLDSVYIQAHPVNQRFTNIGQIGEVLKVDGYNISDSHTEADVRFDIADPNLQGIFSYITLLDPSNDNINNDGDMTTDNLPAAIVDEIAVDQTCEYKIPGRININAAPWFVMAQLPWMTDDIAQAIAAYRDKIESPIDYSGIFGRSNATGASGIREDAGFASIGELMNVYTNIGGDEVYDIGNYATVWQGGDLGDYPDLTPGDGIADDFEERDVRFSRLSNLVTVRSDVFTAYILVRIGTDGPQKRMIAMLDRSDVYPDPIDSSKTVGDVKILALHPVTENR